MYIAALLIIAHSLSPVWLFVIPWTSECQFSLSFTIFWSLLIVMSVELGMLFNHFILCCPLLLPSLLAFIVAIFNKSALQIRSLKYWSFSCSISHANVYSRLTSFKIKWFDLLAVQWILKRFLQHHNLKALIPQYSDFFIVKLSHPYMTTGKTIVWLPWLFFQGASVF